MMRWTAGALLFPAWLAAQEGRVQRTLNDGWRFAYGGQSFAEQLTSLVEPGKMRAFERDQSRFFKRTSDFFQAAGCWQTRSTPARAIARRAMPCA